MKPEHSFSVEQIQPLCEYLGKEPADFHRADLVRYCGAKSIRRLILRYIALDGRISELIVPVIDEEYLNRVLAMGERVDGSNLFPGIFGHDDSDLYVIPEHSTAFQDPFDPLALSVLCRYFNRDSEPVLCTPDEVLRRAFARLKERTGYELWALGEMEYYLVIDKKDDRFTGLTQKNYQQSAPFSHGGAILRDILDKMSSISGEVKYAHSEVGYLDSIVSEDPELDGKRIEQQEIEFLLSPAPRAAVLTSLAKWVIRNCANNAGASATFAPKLALNSAGSGMHLHLALMRDRVNMMQDQRGSLSEEAMKIVGGILKHADLIIALGNTVASSFLRLGSGMEAPVNLCWGPQNREAMVRVPLGWSGTTLMEGIVNDTEPLPFPQMDRRQTVEVRSPDASAFTYLLLTTLCRSVEDGLSDPESLNFTKPLYASSDKKADADMHPGTPMLPASCVESAAALERNRAFLEDGGLVPPILLDHVLRKLRAERDEELPDELRRLPQLQREILARRIMHKDLHKH